MPAPRLAGAAWASHGCPVSHPLRQVAVALMPVRGRQRRTPDRCGVTPDVFGVQADSRVAQPVRPAWVQVRAPGPHRRARPRCPLGVVAPEVQPLRDLVERAVQTDLGDDGPVRVVVTVLSCARPAEHLRPDDAARSSSPPVVEQHAPKALRRPQGGRGQRVLDRLRDAPELSIMAVQEWARTTCGCSSSASTQHFSRSRAYRSSSDAHLNSSPLACSTTKLWFGARPMLRGWRT